MDFTEFVDFTAIVENPLGNRGFAGIDMRDYADIANLVEGWLAHKKTIWRQGSVCQSLADRVERLHVEVVERKVFALQLFDIKPVEATVIKKILSQ